jgi:ABC-2 type transport system ATP-binding protein
MTKIIETEGLTKVYPPAFRAVDGISFHVEKGEIFGFLGPNGAGKTTTIKMLTTLASISEGSCTVAGFDVKKDTDQVRRRIGLVPQDAAADGDLTGMENLLLSAKLYRVPDDTAKTKSNELLGLVGLSDAAGRLARTYSGGMRKRLELISGLINEPEILFLDEPTLGLDTQTRKAMWDYIREVNRERKMTIFLTTHYLEEADSLCDRVAIIDHGQIKVSGSPSELESKLGGDALEIQVPEGPDLTEALASLSCVSEVSRVGSTYTLRMPDNGSSVQEVFRGLSSLGVRVVDTRLTKASLEEVFLNVTGRSLRDEAVNPESAFLAQARARGR